MVRESSFLLLHQFLICWTLPFADSYSSLTCPIIYRFAFIPSPPSICDNRSIHSTPLNMIPYTTVITYERSEIHFSTCPRPDELFGLTIPAQDVHRHFIARSCTSSKHGCLLKFSKLWRFDSGKLLRWYIPPVKHPGNVFISEKIPLSSHWGAIVTKVDSQCLPQASFLIWNGNPVLWYTGPLEIVPLFTLSLK